MSRPWWHTAVIYQIYPRSFQDTNGDGIGDLPGITSRLDHLVDLGVDALWISPFYPSPMADFGYDVADYTDVDPMFGTLDDFDDLLAAAHDRSLRVIIDWVPNHSSDQHPWFRESRSSRHDPKRDWYVWADPAPDGGPPNNWQSVFGGPAWEWDEATGQYYLHSFLREQPDLNWRNPEVEQTMFDTVRFWMDRGVDGLRIDVAHFIMKDPAMRDNPPADVEPTEFKSLGEYDRQDHIHDKGHPDVHEVFRRLRVLLDGYDGERFAVGEIHVFDWAEWVRYYGEADELHMPFNFSLLFAPWDAAEIRSRVDAMEAVLPSWAWPNHVLGNHDEVRLIDRYGGPERARAAAILLLTLRGTPTIYYGEEIGMRQADIPLDRQQDPWGLQVPGQGRDGCRTPMQWGDPFTDSEPWLPMMDEPTVAGQRTDPDSLLSFYRRLLTLRRTLPDLQTGDYRSIDGPDGVYLFRRGESVVVAINFTDEDRRIDLDGEVRFSTDPELEAVSAEGVVLGPDAGVIVVT
ncbi:MAG: DUF3459 domain-containing protein [Acidimicrobiia bacterium]|nr:DUF3459 domain-containing protein [Acidimicrobiia bacterium]NNF69112.1 DUF3459 domain-containing protein [Acidimicrobiia bacterium]